MIITVYHVNGKYYKEQDNVTEQITYDEYAEYWQD